MMRRILIYAAIMFVATNTYFAFRSPRTMGELITGIIVSAFVLFVVLAILKLLRKGG